MEKLRSIEVKKSIPQIKYVEKGYFHCCCNEPFFNSGLNYPLSKTFELIGFVDRVVDFLEPETLRFLEPYRG